MAIDISTLDKLQNKLEKAPDGKWYARTYNGPVVVYEDEITGYYGGPVPGELQDVFAAQRLAATGKVVTAEVNDLTGVTELWAGDTQVTAGGGGISPDATGTLAGRSAHNAEAVGFVYLATDQVPAKYYFREGAAGNWSAAVEVQGPTGATGATGPAGATGPTGASGTNGTNGVDGVTFVSGTSAPDNGDGRPNGTVYVRYTA